MHYLVKVRNETPLIINYSSGNYYRSLDYIPASSILGALKAKKLSERGIWGGERKDDITLNLHLTDAYPSTKDEQQLNIPSLATLYKERDEEEVYTDAVEDIIATIEHRNKWGEKLLRLKKGPRHWSMKNGKAYHIPIRRTSTNILKLDEQLKTAYQVGENGEKIGYLAHIDSIYPGQIFAFEATGEEEDIQFLSRALEEGVFIGSFRSKGYGLIKLVNKYYYASEKQEANTSRYYILDFYGSVSYDYYAKISHIVEKKFEIIGVERRKTFNYNEWETEYLIKTGSLLIVKSDRNLYKLEKESIENNKGGKIVVNHPVHGL